MTPSRPLRVLCVHPGASWATADVYYGLLHGLRQHGVVCEQYRLDTKIPVSVNFLNAEHRRRRKFDKTTPKPNQADYMYHAGVGALEMALRLRVDVVIVVSAMLLHPDIVAMMKQAGLRVVVVFTESPYDEDQEMAFAKLVDGGWTNERSSVSKFRSVNPNFGYLPHGWHPEKHYVSARAVGDLPAHDVVFVGSGFPERITFFNAIDWTGIDLGLYGSWKGLGLKQQVMDCVRSEPIPNEQAAALYRRSKISINLYRVFKGWGQTLGRVQGAESLSPRAYELAACGVFHLSDYRKEVTEVFGDLVPTFKTPTEAAALIRLWLQDDQGRARIAEQLPACVAERSWVSRAAIVLGDLQRLIHQQAAEAVGSVA